MQKDRRLLPERGIEFLTLAGRTAAVVTLEAAQVRAVGHREITHARELAAA